MGAMDFNTDTSPENPKGGSWGGPIPSSAIQKEGSKWHMGETQNRGSEGRVLNKKLSAVTVCGGSITKDLESTLSFCSYLSHTFISTALNSHFEDTLMYSSDSKRDIIVLVPPK